MLVSKNIHVSINIFNYYCNDKKDDNIKYYIRVLSFCGMIIALYQCIIQYFAIKSTFCSFTSNDCSAIQTVYMGFLTIPQMSLGAFILIFVCSFYINNKTNIST